MIQNIWAVGRNYAAHAKELGNAVPTKPLIFLKSGSCLNTTNQIQIPKWASEIHHELELAFQVDDDLQISAWGLALDLTERKFQTELKSQGQPWTLAKSFIGACPISNLSPALSWASLQNKWLELKINNQIRQKCQPKDMIFNPEVLLAYVTNYFPLRPGDLILTGTPEGVGPLKPGDKLQASLGDDLFAEWTVFE